MAVGLETRMPFLDVDVATFAGRISPDLKLRDGHGKWLVRQLLDDFVPRALIDRPKTGFSIPLDAWLRGPLRSWADDLLAPARLRAQSLFDATVVSVRWQEHRTGRRDHAYWLWNVLMAQCWFDQWMARSPS